MVEYRQAHALVAAFIAGWRSQKFPHEQAEVVECPACKGRLSLVQSAAYARANTVSANCDTPFCVHFSE